MQKFKRWVKQNILIDGQQLTNFTQWTNKKFFDFNTFI